MKNEPFTQPTSRSTAPFQHYSSKAHPTISAARSTGTSYEMDAAGVARLEAYFAPIGAHLRDKRKRESFAMYAFGLLKVRCLDAREPCEGEAIGPQDLGVPRPCHGG